MNSADLICAPASGVETILTAARAGRRAYVLLTAAHNEEAFIGATIESVLAQDSLPERWVIVSDRSTDRTDEIVKEYAAEHPLIHPVHLDGDRHRDFACKVNALKAGYVHLCGVGYDFIGNLDADICLPRTYYSELLRQFQVEPMLGVSGGFVDEKCRGTIQRRAFSVSTSVPHAAQLVRKECFEAIGGYVPMKYGGEDWCAEVNARMRGWRVESFPDLRVLHLRPTGTAVGLLRARFNQGRMSFSMGSHPLFELARCLHRISEKPLLAASVLRAAGFLWSNCSERERPVPKEFVAFLREEQMGRLRSTLHFRNLRDSA